MRTTKILALGALPASLCVAACSESGGTARGLSGRVQVDGSSTVAPITMAVAEDFRQVQPGIDVTVGISGTGGGFKRFCKGDTDISDASRPIKKAEAEAARAAGVDFIEIPVAYDGLTFVVNKNNDWCRDLTVDELKKIFLDGSLVRTWKDVRPEFPDVPLRIYAPGTDSGTFDYFKEVVAGKRGNIRSDMSVSEDDNVLVNGVAGEKGALGFFGCAYYFENEDKLRAVAIDGGKGPVLPSKKTIEDGSYSPFSRPLFIYVNARAAERPEVETFVEYYLRHAARLSEEVGYVKLPETTYRIAEANFRARKTGTQFLDESGAKVHGPVTQVYR